MVSLDSSIFAAVVIFLGLVFSLNYLLFGPLLRIQEERAKRTTGTIEQARRKIEQYTERFEQYQSTIKKARLEAYRRQEQVRSEGAAKRSEVMDQARKSAERLIEEARETLQVQVQAAKEQLSREAQEIAQGISAAILQRSA